MSELTAAIAYLRSPLAIRARCETVLEAGIAGTLAHFAVDLAALPAVVDNVAAREQLTARFGQMSRFSAEHVAQLNADLADRTPDERARTWIDLITVSIVLDTDATDSFRAGLYSSVPEEPLRADASGLKGVRVEELAEQSKLARALGGAVAMAPRTFRYGRPGGLVDALRANGNAVTAAAFLQVLLESLGPLWPDGATISGINLGEVWRHPAAGGAGLSEGLVPFHRLAQWLAYSLAEPLETAGIEVQQLGALTALPGSSTDGILTELGVVTPKHKGVIDDEMTVEWRALSIALFDRVVDGVQKKLGKTPAQLPLASVLQLLH
ncbi:MAG TPA: DUF1688 family protein [Kofleriaceae bacterium]